MKLGVIGGGAMGEAIIAAVIKAGLATPDAVRVADVSPSRLDFLSNTYGVATTASNMEAAAADLIVLAVKPQDFETAAPSIAAGLSAESTPVSIMAGVPMAKVAKLLGGGAVVRAMPNILAQIGEAVTIWTAMPGVSETARQGARQIFEAIGKEAFVPPEQEKYLDMATAISGSGPAYVFLFIEALIDAGVHIGLTRDLATTLTLQTVLGAARQAGTTKKHPAELRHQVTSPGGTTAEALRALEAGGFRTAVLEAVVAAFNKSRALGEGDAK